ncbi:unnamed protein product [Rotaria socialis]|uniref:Uncharacterized protein n=1 Tax=Rotaria socialis TaxID=392032 RepID=A0A818EY84_9BILA|nr:unnamed protein product [Rotaria socialis]
MCREKQANNLPRDITAAQNEIGRLQNQLNHVQISLAVSRFSRTTDRQEYNRRINELKQKLEQQDEKLEQQQEMINNLISVNLCTISLFSLVVIFEATYVKLRSTHDDAQPATFNGTKPGIPTDNEQLTR